MACDVKLAERSIMFRYTVRIARIPGYPYSSFGMDYDPCQKNVVPLHGTLVNIAKRKKRVVLSFEIYEEDNNYQIWMECKLPHKWMRYRKHRCFLCQVPQDQVTDTRVILHQGPREYKVYIGSYRVATITPNQVSIYINGYYDDRGAIIVEKRRIKIPTYDW